MPALTLSEKIQKACRFLKPAWNHAKIGIILGSGLSSFADETEKRESISYQDIPHFPQSTAQGHRGALVVGKINSVPLAILAGRFHYYEGYDLEEVTFGVRVLAELGINTLIITNAAGGINPKFIPGDFMILSDHINMIEDNPLRGLPARQFGSPFVDLADAYDPGLRKIALSCGKKILPRIHEGVYMALSGPSYETPAEVKAFRGLGADALGMSTAPEVIVARQCGLKALAVSLISNVHGKNSSTSHAEVLETAKKTERQFRDLLTCVIGEIAKSN